MVVRTFSRENTNITSNTFWMRLKTLVRLLSDRVARLKISRPYNERVLYLLAHHFLPKNFSPFVGTRQKGIQVEDIK